MAAIPTLKIPGFCPAIAIAVLAGAVSFSVAQAQSLPLEPFHNSGQSITAAFEGWFPNADGTFSILFGYYNRNQREELDIPVGPNNRITPGEADRGQPTHFLPGRQWGVFTITVPKDFGDQKLTWTLTANGQTTEVPGDLNPLWQVEPLKDANGNTPPVLRFENGASAQGPRPGTVELTTEVGRPLNLTVVASDDEKLVPGEQTPKTPPVTLTWSKFRGPGAVTFTNAKPPVEKTEAPADGAPFEGKATTTATFGAPGEYILYLLANDWTGKGGRGFQCCWTNAMIDVSVKPGAGEH